MSHQHLVLIHGSWHDGSAWREVIDILRHAGHHATALTLPGHGAGADRSVSFADYVDAVVQEVESSDADKVVLVGHSLGGAVVAAAAEKIAHRLERLVFVAAIIAQHGERLIDIIPPESAALFSTMAAESDDNSLSMPWPVWRERFIGEADLATAERSFAHLTPEPFGPVVEIIEMPGFEALDVPRSYIHCRSDVVFAPGEWHFFPRFFNRLGLCRLIEIDAGHEAVFSASPLLAQAIIDAARE